MLLQGFEYVYRAIEGEIENPFEEVVYQSILGAADVVEWARQKLPGIGQREVPSLPKLQQHISVESIIESRYKSIKCQIQRSDPYLSAMLRQLEAKGW